MRVLKKTYFQVSSDLESLDKVLSKFNKVKQSIIPKTDWLQCRLALAEAFTNAVRHAHKDITTEIQIEIEIILLQESIEMRIWDYGPPFDLEEAMVQNLSQPKNSYAGSGRGIEILSKIADHLSYVRTDDNRNCLLIIKNFSLVEKIS